MFVSVIIPTFNKCKRLELTLLTLNKQTYPLEMFEVIIVDDGSSDATCDVVKNISNIIKYKSIYVYQNNKGRAVARNTGIDRASGEAVIFLDDDRLVASDYIEQHISMLAKSNNNAVVLGMRKNLYLSQFEDEYDYFKDLVIKDYDALLKRAREEYYWKKVKNTVNCKGINWIIFTTGNVSVRLDVLKSVGGFNERFYGWGLEDTELGYRLWKAGVEYKINENAVNYHIEHLRNPKERKEDELRNHKLFYELHPDIHVEYFRKFVYGEVSLEEFEYKVSGCNVNLGTDNQIYFKNVMESRTNESN